MDFKVRKIYSLMLGKQSMQEFNVENAQETLNALVRFKNRFPTRKCLYWVAK